MGDYAAERRAGQGHRIASAVGDGRFHADVLTVGEIDFHHRGFDQHLRAAHVQLVENFAQLVDGARIGPGDDGVQGLVRLDGGGFGAFAALVASEEGGEDVGDIHGVGVVQAEHLGAAGGGGGLVELIDQLEYLRRGPRLAAHHDAVVALVGDQLNALRPGGTLPDLLRGELFQQRHHGAHPSLAQRHDGDFVLVRHVDLLDHPGKALDVVGVIADDDDVRLRHCGDVAVLRNQRAQDLDQFPGLHVLGGDHSGDELLRRQFLHFAVGAGPLLAGGRGLNANHVAGRGGSEVVHPQHREEEFVHRVGIHGHARHHGDVALQPRVDDEGLAGDLRHLGDELVNVGLLDVDHPGVVRHLLGGVGWRAGDKQAAEQCQHDGGEA